MEIFLGVDKIILDLTVDLTSPHPTAALILDDRDLEALDTLP